MAATVQARKGRAPEALDRERSPKAPITAGIDAPAVEVMTDLEAVADWLATWRITSVTPCPTSAAAVCQIQASSPRERQCWCSIAPSKRYVTVASPMCGCGLTSWLSSGRVLTGPK